MEYLFYFVCLLGLIFYVFILRLIEAIINWFDRH